MNKLSKAEQFGQLGGRLILERVNKAFYDKVYQHPWLKQYFATIPQQHIEKLQTNFMQMVLGGDNVYIGKTPLKAHPHMMISEELFVVR